MMTPIVEKLFVVEFDFILLILRERIDIYDVSNSDVGRCVAVLYVYDESRDAPP